MSGSTRLRLTAAASVGVLQLLLAQGAAAETAADGPASAAAASATVGEVIVTAQKREERLKDVPSSVSVVASDQLEKIGATTLTDFANLVPGLSVNSLGTPGVSTVVLRGISTGSISSTLVATYLDNAPLGSSSGFARGGQFQLDLMPYDLDHIEVLRGPQGTLYGASAMGGLLKYVLKPADLNDFEGRAGSTLEFTENADRPTYGVRAMVNMPIIPGVLAVRASGFFQDDAGYIDNVGLHIKNENTTTADGGRIGVNFQPNADVNIRANAVVQDSVSHGIAGVELNTITLQPIFGRYAYNSAQSYLAKPRNQLYSVDGDFNLGFATLSTNTSYSRSRNFYQNPSVSNQQTPDGSATSFIDITLNKFTQEIRLASKESGALQWRIGGFYTDERVRNDQGVTVFNPNGSQIAGLNPFLTVVFPSKYREEAVFGDATYKFSDQFDINAGLRWSSNNQTFFQDLGGPAVGGGHLLRNAQSSGDVTTWSVSPRWRPDPNLMIYGRVATGYRPGGPNVALPGVPPSYLSDTLTNYEVGLKTTQLDGALSLDFALFDIDWKNIQVRITRNGLSFPGNGGTATSKGAEATLAYRVMEHLTLGATASYADAKTEDDVPNLNGKAGDQLPFSPRWNGSLTADYSAPIRSDVNLTAGAAYHYRGNVNSGFASDPANRHTGDINTVDAYVGASFKRIDVRLFARNLLNDRAYNAWLDDTAQTNQAYFIPVQPRTVGVSLDARF
jgi:iron complex outermembrane receptor protein